MSACTCSGAESGARCADWCGADRQVLVIGECLYGGLQRAGAWGRGPDAREATRAACRGARVRRLVAWEVWDVPAGTVVDEFGRMVWDSAGDDRPPVLLSRHGEWAARSVRGRTR